MHLNCHKINSALFHLKLNFQGPEIRVDTMKRSKLGIIHRRSGMQHFRLQHNKMSLNSLSDLMPMSFLQVITSKFNLKIPKLHNLALLELTNPKLIEKNLWTQ